MKIFASVAIAVITLCQSANWAPLRAIEWAMERGGAARPEWSGKVNNYSPRSRSLIAQALAGPGSGGLDWDELERQSRPPPGCTNELRSARALRLMAEQNCLIGYDGCNTHREMMGGGYSGTLSACPVGCDKFVCHVFGRDKDS
jgi:hypothetical protein